MDTLIPGLRATAPQPLPFAPSLVIRSYLLERAEGDLLVYGAGVPAGLGDVTARYLNHWHEAMFAGPLEGVPTLVHELDREQAASRMAVDGTFAERSTLGDDWVVALDVSGSDRARFLQSLELVRELEYDRLVPWAAPAGHAGYATTDAADARRRIDSIIARVRRGESR